MPGRACMSPTNLASGPVRSISRIFFTDSTMASRSDGSRTQAQSTSGGASGSAERSATVPREMGWLYSVATYMVLAMSFFTASVCDSQRPSLTTALSVHGLDPDRMLESQASAFDTTTLTRRPGSKRETNMVSMSQPLSEPRPWSRCLSTSVFQKAMPLSPDVPVGMLSTPNSSAKLSGNVNGTGITGWSWRCWPTAGTSATKGMPKEARALASPTPLSIKSWGD
mmetsp:Transcript_30019/g.75742  ORF Transcript_30019/g.75742 Transcript_30019/m.75742 type:complete len:225 (+) Transcript_30019:400-1074(+)